MEKKQKKKRKEQHVMNDNSMQMIPSTRRTVSAEVCNSMNELVVVVRELINVTDDTKRKRYVS